MPDPRDFVEYKIDTGEHSRWEDIEPLRPIFMESYRDAWQLAIDLSILFGVQVRWNWVGSSQGHYQEAPNRQLREFTTKEE